MMRIRSEGYVCTECALMIANGEGYPESTEERIAEVAEATAGYSLSDTNSAGEPCPDIEHSIYGCWTCSERLHGARMHAVELVPQLPAFSSIGSYPIVYLDKQDNCLCADCASDERLTEADGHAHWEGPPLSCDECSAEIESAYGDPESEAS